MLLEGTEDQEIGVWAFSLFLYFMLNKELFCFLLAESLSIFTCESEHYHL